MKRALFLLALPLSACVETTGSGLVTFTTRAGGFDGVTSPLAFDSGSGFHVTLTRAQERIAAVYLNQGQPSSGAGATPCILPGIYGAEAFGPVTLDLLSPTLQDFPNPGEGTADPTQTAQVWLNGGDIDATDDDTHVLEVEGTAMRGGTTWPFSGAITIGANRALPVMNPALPGANPICHQRIVTPIVAALLPATGGALELRVDVRGMFNGVDFSKLTTPEIPDTNAGAGEALFKGLLSNAGVYSLTWRQ
jgi:hypothetical protein